MKKTMMMIGLAGMLCGTSGCFFTASCGGNVLAYPAGMVLDTVTAPYQVPEMIDYCVWLTYKYTFPSYERWCDRIGELESDLARNPYLIVEDPNYLHEYDEKGRARAEFKALIEYVKRKDVQEDNKIKREVIEKIVNFVLEHPEYIKDFGGIWSVKGIAGAKRLKAIDLIRRYPASMPQKRTLWRLMDHPSLSDEILRQKIAECPLDLVSYAALDILEDRKETVASNKKNGGGK